MKTTLHSLNLIRTPGRRPAPTGHPIRFIASALLLVSGVYLGGCETVTDTRWTLREDTAAAWEPILANIPISIHGHPPGSNSNEVSARTFTVVSEEGGMRSVTVAATASTQRLEIYLGGNMVPTDGTYCAAAPVLRTVPVPADKVMLHVALCDGPRLVATAHQQLSSDAMGDMGQVIRKIKSRLVFALSGSNAQIPTDES